MSDNAYALDTRFGSAAAMRARLREVCGRENLAHIAGCGAHRAEETA